MRPDPDMTPMEAQMAECERMALEDLARGRFIRFGLYAAQWRLLNRLTGAHRENPFRALCDEARALNQPYRGDKSHV